VTWRPKGAALASGDLRGADLRGARLADVDLRGADLRGADLRGVLAMWSAVDLREARLDGCDLRDADLSGVDARAASLTGANLEGSRWDGADLTGADLTHVRLGWRSMLPAVVPGESGATAPVSFVAARLDYADMTSAHLPGAVFDRASMCGVRAGAAVLTGSSASSTELSRADLRGADLCDADLRDAVVCAADLDGAALLGARLIGTRLDGASVDGVRAGATLLQGVTGSGLTGDVLHLAPGLAAPGTPEVLREWGAERPATTCLLIGDPDCKEDAADVDRRLAAVGVVVYSTVPDVLRSPAGQVVAVRAFDGHPFTVAVTRTGQEAGWLSALRRAAAGRPVWAPRFVVDVRVGATRSVATAGTVPASMRHLATGLG
jgi:uncharacterized protein YjbI with pentapeptide repeats